MPLTIFCHWFSKPMAKYSMLGSQRQRALPSCHCDTCPWAASLLSRAAPLAVLTHLSQLLHGSSADCATHLNSACDAPSLLAVTDPGWAKSPLKRFSFASPPAEGNCLLSCLKSAKIVPATLGKSPGYEFFMLKMETWGHCSYYNFLNSQSFIFIPKINKYMYSGKGFGSSWAAWLRGWIKAE